MCTVSWLHQPGGYHLLCNRDEKLSRRPGDGPRVEERAGVRFIAPSDRDFGGTWIAVNELGVGLCLLNGGPGPQPARRSRGLLLRELIFAESVGECASWLKQIDLTMYAPLTVAMIEPDRSAAVAEWDGDRLTVHPSADDRMPLISSSFDPQGVRELRAREFAQLAAAAGGVDLALLYWFHSSHHGQPSAYSPCMHRDDAETVSFSWVVVTKDEVRFTYSPAAPCVMTAGEQQLLARAA